MEYGLQLYSVRDAIEKNFEGALRQVAEMGYSMVEGIPTERPAAELYTILGYYGLKLHSNHLNIKAFENDEAFKKTVDFHKALGCHELVLGAVPNKTHEDIEYSINTVNKYIPLLKKEGMRLHYHNHSKEFFLNKEGIVVFDEIVNRTELMLQLDIFWAFNAGKSPMQMMEQYRDRMLLIHLKDGIVAEDIWDSSKGAKGKPLGKGQAPVAESYKKACELGMTVIVESENLDPDGITEVKNCIEYLKKI
jgi:sugar phosphate isomerase/epimerase